MTDTKLHGAGCRAATAGLELELVNERKYTAHSLDADRALTIVRHVCVPHPQYHQGRVNSIYFDTPHLQSYYEKINGDNLKRKYRLRWYDVGPDRRHDKVTAYMEIKYRFGSARDKLRRTVETGRAWLSGVKLNDPGLVRFFYDCARECRDHIPLHLYPVVCISYDRQRFLCRRTGLTVCVDSNIRATRINHDMFCAAVPFDLNTVVCECKGCGFPDIPWGQTLYHAGFRIRSFSKYGECVNQALYGGAPTVMRMSI